MALPFFTEILFNTPPQIVVSRRRRRVIHRRARAPKIALDSTCAANQQLVVDTWVDMPKRKAASANLSHGRSTSFVPVLSDNDDGIQMDVHVPDAPTSSSAGAGPSAECLDNVRNIKLVSGENVRAAFSDDFGLTGCTIAVPNSTWPAYSGGFSKCYVHGLAQETSVGSSYIVSCVAYPGAVLRASRTGTRHRSVWVHTRTASSTIVVRKGEPEP